MVRYPDIAELIYTTISSTDSDGNIEVDTETLEIEGRYEPKVGGKNLDYSGKFYCEKLNLEQFKLDNSKLVINEMEFRVTHLYNYQKHCEIWVQ